VQLPNDRQLLRCDNKSTLYKIISKYFSYAGADIPVKPSKNYFADKEGEAVKGTDIPQKNKLFKIIFDSAKKESGRKAIRVL